MGETWSFNIWQLPRHKNIIQGHQKLFPKAVMSERFSLVLAKASYSELSCVTVGFSSCLLSRLAEPHVRKRQCVWHLARPGAEMSSSWLVYILLWCNRVRINSTWLNANREAVFYPFCCRWKAACLCAYLHDLESDNRVTAEKYRQGSLHVWQRNTVRNTVS